MWELDFANPGLDADAVLAEQPTRPEDLLAVWLAGLVRAHCTDLREQAAAVGVAETVRDVDQRLVTTPEASPLQALEASRQLNAYLARERAVVVGRARRDGATWTDIGQALGMSKQAAWATYRDVSTDPDELSRATFLDS